MTQVADTAASTEPARVTGARLVFGYAVLAAAFAVAAIFSISAGHDEEAPPAVAGVYDLSRTACLGDSAQLEQSGQFVDLTSGDADAKLRLRDGRLKGTVNCAGGGTAAADLVLRGEGDNRRFAGTLGGRPVRATYAE